jgi:hypothetical protein
MHQWMAAVIDFFALVKGFAIWHARYLRHYEATFHPLRPRAGVSQMPTSSGRAREPLYWSAPTSSPYACLNA